MTDRQRTEHRILEASGLRNASSCLPLSQGVAFVRLERPISIACAVGERVVFKDIFPAGRARPFSRHPRIFHDRKPSPKYGLLPGLANETSLARSRHQACITVFPSSSRISEHQMSLVIHVHIQIGLNTLASLLMQTARISPKPSSISKASE